MVTLPSNADLEPKLAVEDFEITKVEKDAIWFNVKIRNISEKDLDTVGCEFQLLDSNGDILCGRNIGATNLSAGQARWAGTFSAQSPHLHEATAISFSSTANTIDPQPLREKVIFQLDDYM